MEKDDEHTGLSRPAPAAAAAPASAPQLAAFDQAPVGILHLDLDGRILRANTRMCKLLDLREAALMNQPFAVVMAAEDAARVQADLAQMLATPDQINKYEVRLVRKGGQQNWAHLSTYVIVDTRGAPSYLVWWISDIEQRKQLKDMLQLSTRALAACSNGILITDAADPALPIMYANPAFCSMTGYERIDIMGRNCRFLQGSDRDQPGIAVLREAIAAQRDARVVLRNYRKDGSLFWNDLFVSPVPDDKGNITHYIGILNDITAFKENEEKLAFRATHDELTGLPNRSLFNERLEQAVLHAARRTDSVALLSLGVDNFNLVNESLGHAAGDALLAGVAQRLVRAMRASDTVSRHGGNELIMLLGEVNHTSDVSHVCDTLFAALAAPFAIGGQQLHASCSIGITLYPQDGGDGATLLRYADMALSRARALGGARHQFFSAEMNQRTVERIALEAALRVALAQDQLQMLYQPLVELQQGQVCGIEALLRWQHPELGLVPAQRFVPIAEEAGLIGAIGDWVLGRVCRDLQAWQAAGLAPPPVAINLSPRQFRDRQLATKIDGALRQHDLDAGLLAVEITETVLMQDAGASAAMLDQLKALGIGLALDDFGTGYSSLSHLKRFPLDLVKIDGALVRNALQEPNDAALTQSIIAMAHHLGLKVLAEGVETEAQCDFLRRNQCDQIQGYLFSVPLAADALAAQLTERRALPSHLLHIQKRERKLLLVDDEANIVSSLKRLLRRDGYTIYSADSGQQGLALLATERVDVIVSDQRMPGMLGADFLRKAKDIYPDTIRIMLSGYTELQSVTDAVNEGAIYKFLTKPWEDEQLRGHIAEAFRLKEIADENERLNQELRTANQALAAANRKMEELLRQKQQQITRDEISLNIARELLELLPLPVIGVDDAGMIAFVNAGAAQLFGQHGALLGEEAALVLPALFPDGATLQDNARRRVRLGAADYDVLIHPMGANSQSRGSLITVSRVEEPT